MKTIIVATFLTLLSTVGDGQTNPYDVITKSPSNQISLEENSGNSDFSKQFPFLKMIDWKPGMRFMTEPLRDKKFDTYSTIKLAPYKSKDFFSNQLKQADFLWKTFIYQGIEERKVRCPRGKCLRTYLIFDCENKKYEFEFIGDTTELRNSIVFNTVDKLVYLDEVDKVKKLLLNKTVYIMTNQWMRDDENGDENYYFSKQKFVPVIVTSVGIGIQDAPSKIVFKQVGADNESYLNIRISGINKASGVFGFDFDKVFQFEDPKLKYPNIPKPIWEMIQNGQVEAGMTKEECRLSWGNPKSINKTIASGEETEQWVYSISSYLYFSNDILEAIQN